ncbi:DUF2800 domain-containing protein [Pelosinus sp. IPA-1]|uniref:DUF2800 domain-containing protein n=1 Tax=Pelosinus sp. IPA-1 TaxID=3029569 RepID=UPI0024361B89|nr:DUF2800 domain-containing protein [Pelosinus sp. IPA-1]GMB00894.1 hypothetical protein PIPA1_36930 [Pelosinus sp. IPA-1]
MAAHAKLSASGSKRWLSCTPSAELEQQFPNSTSVYADEGSFAHSVGEVKIRRDLVLIQEPEYKKQYEVIKKNNFYCEELEQATQEYADLVFSKVAEAQQKTEDAIVLIEEKLDFSRWVPQGFGTGDVVIIGDGCIEIVDLKYGKGVPVSAEENTQMMLYALGAIAKFEHLYDIHTARMTICQPRLDSVSTYEMPIYELLAWGDHYVKPRADMAIKGEGDFVAGDHCRFCRAKATCKARADENLELLKYEFRKDPLLTDEEVGEILGKAEELQKWAKDVQDYALEHAEKHGKKWPGWKLVEGRSNRKYTDDLKVAETLKNAGYKDDKIYEPQKLLGITALEKSISKKQFGILLSDLVVKPTGKPTLVPESDKRDEISSTAAAESDFGPVDASLLD